MLPGAEDWLQSNQKTFIESHAGQLGLISDQYSSHFDDYLGMIQEALEHHDDPHNKMMLRIHAWKDILDLNIAFEDLWTLPGKCTLYKMKIFEIAKPKKIPRMIVDLGVHNSLQGFRITKFLKHAMAKESIHYLGGEIEFCPKPDPASLARVFAKLIDPPGAYYFVYFSDDSCIAIRTKDGVVRFNVDISSCDASHTEKLFDALTNLVPKRIRKDAKFLVKQCTTPLTVVNLQNRKEKVVLKPLTPRLYSGSTLTTAINNLACILIAFSVAESKCTGAPDIIRAAARAGYIVTCDDCSDWRKLQFLKHSPVYDTNDILRPLLNIGVLLRLSGTCKGDLPGRKTTPLRTRAESFQASLLRGAYPKANFTLIDNLREHVGVPTAATKRVVDSMFEHKICDKEDYPAFRVSSAEVFARYDLNELQIAELEIGFGKCRFGEHYTSSGTSAVLALDYGLSGKEL